jgi:hypothetical protein
MTISDAIYRRINQDLVVHVDGQPAYVYWSAEQRVRRIWIPIKQQAITAQLIKSTSGDLPNFTQTYSHSNPPVPITVHIC